MTRRTLSLGDDSNARAAAAVRVKLGRLAAWLAPGHRGDPSSRIARSPRAALSEIEVLSREVTRCTARPGEREELAHDLFRFLGSLPPQVRDGVAFESVFPPEPVLAADEPDAHPFWRLAALVQDVWEHTLGREATSDREVSAVLRRSAEGAICDFGSGAGYFAFALARQGHDVVCIEANPIKRAFLEFRRSARPEGRHIQFEPRRRYDTMLAIDVLDHVRKPTRTLRELAALLRPGGRFFCIASFEHDGWHQGGARLRRNVYRSIRRHFRFVATPGGLARNALILERRSRNEALDIPSPDAVVQLDPAAVTTPHPGSPCAVVLTAPRFYAKPLALTAEGRFLATLCREPLRVGEACRQMRRRGFRDHETLEALERMRRSRLAFFERPNPECSSATEAR